MARVTVKTSDIENAKSLQLKLWWPGTGNTNSVLWDFPLPAKPADTKITASPPYLREGDSSKVTFSGGALASATAVNAVNFETCGLPTFNFDPTKKTLDV